MVTNRSSFAASEMFQRAESGGGVLRNRQMSKWQSQFKCRVFAKFDHRGERKFGRKFLATRKEELL